MKVHNGMRPHDVVILLKLVALNDQNWTLRDLSSQLHISLSEISMSLKRSHQAGLLSSNKKRVMKANLHDFLIHGLKYVFPVKPGPIVRGMRTGHSAAPLWKDMASDEPYVWPFLEGNARGQSIEPLHPNVPFACSQDSKLWELLAVVDAIRAGRTREHNLAIQYLTEELL